MKIFYRKYGENKTPLLILHGLYGASDNWVSIAKKLSVHFTVYVLDQRNHGKSPHSSRHNYEALSNDLYEFLSEAKIEKAILLGHSMGGKAIMTFANKYQQKIISMIIIDVAPKNYSLAKSDNVGNINHNQIINAMLNIDFAHITSRPQVLEYLQKNIDNNKMCLFLMKNLQRNKNASFNWKLNIKAINENMPFIADEIIVDKDVKFEFPILFIRGKNSDYILDADIPDIFKIYRSAKIKDIPESSHWIHVDKPELLLKNILNFLC